MTAQDVRPWTLTELHALAVEYAADACQLLLRAAASDEFGRAHAPASWITEQAVRSARKHHVYAEQARLVDRVIRATGCDPLDELEFEGVSFAACAECGDQHAVTTLSVAGEPARRICGDCAGLPA